MYLDLFVTQLQNQDPMEPMSNYEFTSQLAQMAQTEAMTNMNSSFDAVMRSMEFANAASLIGNTVTYLPEEATEAASGRVSGVKLVDGQVQLVVGTDSVPLDSITQVVQSDSAE
jgi:flagellar basal-body rod modification protein FlgD